MKTSLADRSIMELLSSRNAKQQMLYLFDDPFHDVIEPYFSDVVKRERYLQTDRKSGFDCIVHCLTDAHLYFLHIGGWTVWLPRITPVDRLFVDLQTLPSDFAQFMKHVSTTPIAEGCIHGIKWEHI